MEQKRFLTAGEVFQLFGVDAEALDALVESGDVKPLADLGTFKYRSEDFANLVKSGKLTPRLSGELFQVDSHGDMPFLKVKDDTQGFKFDENVSFIELDEDALNEQVDPNQGNQKTPVIAENWFEDEEDAAGLPRTSDTSDDLPVAKNGPVVHEEATEFELKIGSDSDHDSDSNVRIFDQDASIDFDEPDVASSGSDSDVRLEGPISAPSHRSSGIRKKSDSDSDVRRAKSVSSADSDSDVQIASSAKGSPTVFSGPPEPASTKKLADSDSDVRIASESGTNPDSDSDVKIVASAQAASALSSDSDSDVTLADDGTKGVRASVKSDSDSDVRLADAIASLSSDAIPVTGDSSVRLDGDSDVRSVLAHSPQSSNVIDDDSGIQLDAGDSGIRLGSSDSRATQPSRTDDEIAIESAMDDSGIAMESVLADSGISLDSDQHDSGISWEGARTDSEIAIQPDSGIAMESVHANSGLALDGARTDSEIVIQPVTEDSGISMESIHSDSGISLENALGDSGLALDSAPNDSGISFDSDSGISFDSDSGIMLEKGDSGIGLEHAGDSGIKLAGIDSGLSLEDASDPNTTVTNIGIVDFEPKEDFGKTQTLELTDDNEQDSAFDVSLADGDHTMEMALDEDDMASPETAATMLQKGRSAGPKSPSLSEAFNLDEPVEVEDLDISDDLEGVVESEFSDEFEEAEEEVLEASDDDFSAGEISVAEDDEGDSEEFAPAVKVRAAPKEPAWGMLAVAPIMCASLVMAVTVIVLWGGIETMWTGQEPSGPAGMLISTLAGLI